MEEKFLSQTSKASKSHVKFLGAKHRKLTKGDINKILRLYQTYQSGHKVAKLVGYSPQTVYNVLKSYSIDTYAPADRGVIPTKRWGKVAHALRKYNKRITNWKDFAEEHGFDPHAVYMFVSRARRDLVMLLESIPDPTETDCYVKDYGGVALKCSDFVSYEFLVDKYTFHVALAMKDFIDEWKYFPIYRPDKFKQSVEEWYTAEGRDCPEGVSSVRLVKSIPEQANLPEGQGVQTASEFASRFDAFVPSIKAVKDVNRSLKVRATAE